MASDEMPVWGWIVLGVVGLAAGAGVGWGIYEKNRANKEQKKRQDTEFDWQNSEANWQNRERGLIIDLKGEAEKREKLQQTLDSLLTEFEHQNPSVSPAEANSMREIFNVFASDGANIYSTHNNGNEYLLSDNTVRRAIDICTTLQNDPNLQRSDLGNADFFRRNPTLLGNNSADDLLLQINNLKQRLSLRLADEESRKNAAEEWSKIVDSCQKGTPVTVTPIRRNKGGFICAIGRIYSGFLPNSHSGDSCLINQPIEVLILDADDGSRRVIVSVRELKRRTDFDNFFANKPIGYMVSGKIVKILGEDGHAALVSIADSGICGYLPKSNVIGHPLRLDGFFTVDQSVNVYVKKIDFAERHVLLSMYNPLSRSSKFSKKS